MATSTATYTRTSWAHELLRRLGITPTTENTRALVVWAGAEGGHWANSAHYNPLNTTQPAAGATSMNSVGVKAYNSWDQGFDATVQTLNNGRYGGILDALRSGSAMDVANAVAASPWGTGSLMRKLLGSAGSDTSKPSTGPASSGTATLTAAAGGLNINPLDGFGIPGAIASSLGKDLMRVAIEGAIVIGGVTLVVLGLYRGVQPAVQRVQQVATDVGKAAAA